MHKKTNKRQHRWAKCETCELQQGTGDKGKLWKGWGWKLGTYILHTHTSRQGIPERSVKHANDKSAWVRGGGSYPLLPQIWVSICTCTKKQTSVSIPERGAQNTHTIQDPLRMVRQAGGRKGWRVLPPAQKTKKMKSRDHFSYLSEVYKMSEVCKITRTIQNRFDMGGRVRTPYWQDAWMARRRRSSWAPPKWYVVFFRRENTQQTRN